MPRSGSFADIEAETPYPGILRRTIHSERMTLSEYTFAPGATFPLHRHTQEQVTLIEAGEVRLTAGGITAGPDGARIVAILSPRRRSAGEITLTPTPEA
jgi:predicted metal-dependent enzyme (double-stranded beta helix superfamily)